MFDEDKDPNETQCENMMSSPRTLNKRPPITRERRGHLLALANKIAAQLDEVTDPRERRLCWRMVDMLTAD